MTRLPVEDALPEFLSALARAGRAVLQAPPGAGKTTLVPLAIHHASLSPGRIVMLEPRRLAARAAAERMAEMLGEPVGRTVGYRMRGATKVSRETRIDVVTEGVLTRMLLADPGLDGIGMLIFDEFHERSLNADLGLALAWEVRGALRDDLKLLVMSATLDAAPVAAMLDAAPVITAEGRAYPVETIWLDRPLPRERRLEDAAADLIRRALSETEGGVLAFLPGAGEIRLTAMRLGDLPGCAVRPLYGALPPAVQRAAIRPDREARKVVLATSIAETSLTIEDVRVVVDCGLARRQRHDAASGMARLVTERVTLAEADQRRGRAGRVAPGTCYRLWTRGEEGALARFPPPEIAVADLARPALDLALWGARDGTALALLTQPPAAALAEAQALLLELGMIETDGAPTEHGRRAAELPLHPRLAHMATVAGDAAASVAALLSEPPPPGAPTDLVARLAALQRGEEGYRAARTQARRLARALPQVDAALSLGAMVALAYPDRVALRRPGDAPRYLLSGGKGAALPPDDPLAHLPMLAVAETDGHPREARIRQAAVLIESELRDLFPDRIHTERICEWSRREGRVLAVERERFGALVLVERPWRDAPDEAVTAAMLQGVRTLGLGWSATARRLRARIALASAEGHDLPDVSDEALTDRLEEWLAPHLSGVRTAAAWQAFDLTPALEAMLDWPARQALDQAAPSHYGTPTGRSVAIDYSGEAPEVAVRLQEMFGVTSHPVVAGRPLRITLLSPAGRPLQTTTDLPGFWSGSYVDVRKDMRGRYPRHPWPDDPTAAQPTLRAKPRG
ncbi:ATP-dependent helicase HrpB [Roseitranquillus sediminis]|uniref:ATP-dependent helicase HrpB n=1 Tax=Roseitranquillus sediminis TaxID=2809051 RepID=UPI001D0C86E5|nr:ATP-dependent helicase HrpB [Roseitranquillus sediminis]MBM9594344.1 ATP-dependent helicase HrpB [Roseitranquillus sediminis]